MNNAMSKPRKNLLEFNEEKYNELAEVKKEKV